MENDVTKTVMRRWSAAECTAMLEDDPHKFIFTKREEFAIGSRRALYNLMQAAAHLTIELERNSKLRVEILEQEPHASRHKKPTTNAALAMQKLTGASDENSSGSANKKAKVLDGMLKEGLSPEEIAERLTKKGGVAGAFRFLVQAPTARTEESTPLKRKDDQPRARSEEERYDDQADDEDWEEDDVGTKVSPHNQGRAEKTASSKARASAERRCDPGKLTIPRPSKGYEYLFVEIPCSQFDYVLAEGVAKMTVEANRMSMTWVRASMVDDDQDFHQRWDLANLKLPAPTEAHVYLYLEVRHRELARLLDEGDHEISYEVTQLTSGWMQARVIDEDDDQDDRDESNED